MYSSNILKHVTFVQNKIQSTDLNCYFITKHTRFEIALFSNDE